MSTTPALTQVVAFRLGEDLFAADIFALERVLRYSEPRSLPGAPEWTEGVIDYRSRVVPVVDMRKRFQLPDTSITQGTRLLIFHLAGDFVAAIVDEVLDVMHVGGKSLSAPPSVYRGLSAEYLLGVTMRGERTVVVLDFARVFSSSERMALESIGQRGSEPDSATDEGEQAGDGTR
jgi:purine-binding chemotaxis protein CheW